jgi:ribonuclease HII
MPLSRPTTNDQRLARERAAWSTGTLLIGLDEVGRGPLAGPVVAGAVVFPEGHPGVLGVRDSKLIKKQAEREAIARAVRTEALAWAVGAASVREIATLNIRRATALAMTRALARCRGQLGDQPVHILVDGLPVPELGSPHEALVKGDANCHTIGAAAILAKVVRDRLMQRLAVRHDAYGWDSNVGYGSAGHMAAIRVHGLTEHHREQFCRGVSG